MPSLKRQSVLIVGSSRGLGRAIFEALLGAQYGRNCVGAR